MDIQKLEQINDLKEKGVLSQKDFDKMKAEILSDSSPIINNAAQGEPASDALSLWGYFKLCVTQKYACLSGRARRKEYWSFSLFYFLIDTGLSLVSKFLNTITGMPIEPPNPFISILQLIISIGLIIPSIGVYVRRLHDIGLSGWWCFIPLLALFLMVIGSVLIKASVALVIAGLLALAGISGLVFTIVVPFIPSQKEENKYGPVPKGIIIK